MPRGCRQPRPSCSAVTQDPAHKLVAQSNCEGGCRKGSGSRVASTYNQHSLWCSMPGKPRGIQGPVCTLQPSAQASAGRCQPWGQPPAVLLASSSRVACELSSNSHRPHLWPVTQTSGVLPGLAFTTSLSSTAWISGHTWQAKGEDAGRVRESGHACTHRDKYCKNTPTTQCAAELPARRAKRA